MCHDVGHQGPGGLFTQVALDRDNFGGGMARKDMHIPASQSLHR